MNQEQEIKPTGQPVENKSPSVIKWALIAGIIIVLNLFFAFAIKTVYQEPKYDQFCKEEQVKVIPNTKNECIAGGGRWTDSKQGIKGAPRVAVSGIESDASNINNVGYCDTDYTCRNEYQDSRDLYGRNIFVALMVIGVLLIIGSLFIKGIETLSLGLSMGGVLSLIIGSIRYWSAMDDYIRVVVLGIALVALIWITIKKFRD